MQANENDPTFSDFGGIAKILERLRTSVVLPMVRPDVVKAMGILGGPASGVLHGPPGSGKTMLAHAIAKESDVPIYSFSLASWMPENEIRDILKNASDTAPSIVLIDNMETIGSSSDFHQNLLEKKMITMLKRWMDEMHGSPSKSSNYVIIIGATRRLDAIDPSLRRTTRFGWEILLDFPHEEARKEILEVLLKKDTIDDKVNLTRIARVTWGFVGCDLKELVRKARVNALRRTPSKKETLIIEMVDLEEAAKSVQPRTERDGICYIPSVKWEDVCGLESVKTCFHRRIIRRFQNPNKCEAFGLVLKDGFLLQGPPGCGKTLIAKAVASEADINFMHVKCAELYRTYLAGGRDLSVSTIFRRTKICSPCVLFFDEIEWLAAERSRSPIADRILMELLFELDESWATGVFIIGATNRLTDVDSSVFRPDRLGNVLHVPLPSEEERLLILKALLGTYFLKTMAAIWCLLSLVMCMMDTWVQKNSVFQRAWYRTPLRWVISGKQLPRCGSPTEDDFRCSVRKKKQPFSVSFVLLFSATSRLTQPCYELLTRKMFLPTKEILPW